MAGYERNNAKKSQDSRVNVDGGTDEGGGFAVASRSLPLVVRRLKVLGTLRPCSIVLVCNRITVPGCMQDFPEYRGLFPSPNRFRVFSLNPYQSFQ